MNQAQFKIPVKAPFKLDLAVWVLRRRPKNIIDSWDGKSYSRILVLQDCPVQVAVSEVKTSKTPKLLVKLSSSKPITADQQTAIKATIIKMLGLNVDLEPFYALASRNQHLGQLAEWFVGFRPTRYPNLFEALINAIACQQVSLDAGISLLNRLTQRFGPSFKVGRTSINAFPRPQDLMPVSEDRLRLLGFSRQKARAIKGLVIGIVDGQIDLEQLETMDDTQALNYLQAIHGIGRWSAEYALLRGLGRLNVFPGDDIGGQNNLQRLLSLPTRPDHQKIQELTASWQPYAGLAYFYLLLDKLESGGALK